MRSRHAFFIGTALAPIVFIGLSIVLAIAGIVVDKIFGFSF